MLVRDQVVPMSVLPDTLHAARVEDYRRFSRSPDWKCFGCGERLGKHRYGDDACPNVHWRCGNGQPQWRESWHFRLSHSQ
jgi:hypothetical protein